MSSALTSLIENLKTLVKPDTERTLESFVRIFNQFMNNQPEEIAQSHQQKAIIADTLHWYMRNGEALSFTCEEARLAIGIHQELSKHNLQPTH
jgi:hypothetical protein